MRPIHRHASTRTAWTRATAALALCAITLAAGACTPKLGRGPVDELPDIEGEPWRPRPAAVHVLQSTRFVYENDKNLLEARVELRDDMGDPVKAPGVFQIEVFPRLVTSGQRLIHWDVPVLDRQDQRRHFDPITLAYRFQLDVEDDRLFRRPIRVRVRFGGLDRPEDNRWIQDSLELGPQAKPAPSEPPPVGTTPPED